MEKSCVFAPATIANVNVGFDVLGLALSGIGDKVEVAFNGQEANRIADIINGDNLPREAEKNCCTGVIARMQEALGDARGVDVRIQKGFPSGSGLGSSSASSAAAAAAYNHLMGSPFTREELLPFAAAGEQLACGTAHFDNVAPALLGGLNLIHEGKAIALPIPEGLYAVALLPEVEINTSISRDILPQRIPLTTTARQVANMGAFASACYQQDIDLLRNCLQDLLVEPARKVAIPFFDEMRAVAHEQNAITFGISGSGPSVFALTQGETSAHQLAAAFTAVFADSGIATQTLVEPLNDTQGCRITTF